MASNVAENMRKATNTLVKAFEGPKWSVEAALAPRALECEHVMLPVSLGIPKKNNEEWAARVKQFEGLITDSMMNIDDYVADTSSRRAVCRSSLKATTPVGPYVNEYVWFLTFDENGEKIVSITEFFDTKAAADILSRLEEGGFVIAH